MTEKAYLALSQSEKSIYANYYLAVQRFNREQVDRFIAEGTKVDWKVPPPRFYKKWVPLNVASKEGMAVFLKVVRISGIQDITDGEIRFFFAAGSSEYSEDDEKEGKGRGVVKRRKNPNRKN